MTEKKKAILRGNFSKADKTLQAVPLFFPGEKVKVNSVKTEYLDAAGRAYLEKVDRFVSQRFHNLMEMHYKPSPENS